MMPSFSQKPSSSRYLSLRSITLPVRSHPTTHRVEQELYKLKAAEISLSSSKATTTTIFDALSGLGELYKCIKDLLGLPLTQQALAQHQQEKWVHELLDDSLRYLDFCGNTRDAVLLMKASVRELQSAIRRSKVGESSIESHVNAYTGFRKAMKKEIAQSLKQLDAKHGVVPLDLDSHLCAVVRVLRESSSVTSAVFRSLSSFLSTQVLKPKPSKWSLVSIMDNNNTQNQKSNMNEIGSADMALGELLLQSSSEDVEDDKIQSAQRKLEALESVIQGFENGLESLFMLLIHNRVCLLNVISQ